MWSCCVVWSNPGLYNGCSVYVVYTICMGCQVWMFVYTGLYRGSDLPSFFDLTLQGCDV